LPRYFRASLAVAVAVGAVRLLWLAVSYTAGDLTVRRHHVESAAFIFAALLLLQVFASGRDDRRAVDTPRMLRGWVLVLALCVVVALLFARAIGIGLFSDDFVIYAWARRFELTPDEWTYLRPVPIALWSSLAGWLPPTDFAVAAHVFNVVLHMVNAVLTYGVGRALGGTFLASSVAALLFAVFPANVEAVVWASAVFDVLLVCLTLVLAHLALRRPAMKAKSLLAVVALSAAGLLTKESFVVAPALIALLLFAARAPRVAYWPAMVGAGLSAIYSLWRLSEPGIASPYGDISGYVLKEIVSRPFASLALPYHESFLQSRSVLVSVGLVAVVSMLAALAYASPVERPRRVTLACLMWVLVAVLPLGSMMHVTSELQGSRYLYLPLVGWALLLGLGADCLRPPAARAASALLLVSISVVATWSHVTIWIEASGVRDRSLTALADAQSCSDARAVVAPDSFRGVYVFRNGLDVALDLTVDVTAQRRMLQECGIAVTNRQP
jgi:hypothetical protein